jgi:glutamyl-tRNA synthetase
VRVRIAPGPTGPFHIGRSRTAVLNWLFARHEGGVFVLRIEDTDRERSKPEHLNGILDSLRWLGLQWDEGPEAGGQYGPYFQMGRLETYQAFISRLEETGKVYRCYCTPAELDALRKHADRERRPFRYPRTCRYLTAEERSEREARGLACALRLAIPTEGATSWVDMVLGEISVANEELDDFIIVRSDGVPVYNFVVVVDDCAMKITHVIRGQDHVSNTPKQILLYEALGEPIPQFGHAPLVVGLEGKKISARFGAEPVLAYGKNGYLPEAVLNYLATVGVSYEGDREIFSPDELVAAFDISRIGKASAAFDQEKLDWMNGVYIRQLPLDEFVRLSLPFLQLRELVSTPPAADEVAYATRALRLEQERVKTLAETPDAVEFFFVDPVYDPEFLVVRKSMREDTARVLEGAIDVVGRAEDFTHDTLERDFRALVDRLELDTTAVFQTVRVAITGRTASPPLFDTMTVIGRWRVQKRLEDAHDALGGRT